MKNKILITLLALLSLFITSCGSNNNKNETKSKIEIEKKVDMKINSVKTAIGGKANEKESTFKETSKIINTAEKGKEFNKKNTDVEVKWK